MVVINLDTELLKLLVRLPHPSHYLQNHIIQMRLIGYRQKLRSSFPKLILP